MINDKLLGELHDGYLVALLMDRRQHRLTLKCERVDDARLVTIQLDGVRDFCAFNVRLGNIILSAEVFTDVNKLSEEMIRRLAQSERKEQTEKYVKRLQDQASQQLKYFLLESSYGCDLAVVFEGGMLAN